MLLILAYMHTTIQISEPHLSMAVAIFALSARISASAAHAEGKRLMGDTPQGGKYLKGTITYSKLR